MFFDILVSLCSNHHITPTKLVMDLGISKSNVTNWKLGKIPKSDTIQKIAAYFGVSTDYLLGNTTTKKEPAALEDDELTEYLEYLKNREDGRMLFSLAKNASKEDVMRAVAIIEALRKQGDENA